MPKFRGGDREHQVVMVQERPIGATPRTRLGAVTEKSYPTLEVRGGGQEELPHV